MTTPSGKVYSEQELVERRARLCANTKRWRKNHLEEARAKERARYHERKAEITSAKRASYAANREARIASSKKWVANHPEQASSAYRRHHLWRWYGMTVEEFDSLLSSQGGKCAICSSSTPGQKNWHIDHDHSTAEVRGILCYSCNLMLGHAHDSPKTLRAAINYLRAHCQPVIENAP